MRQSSHIKIDDANLNLGGLTGWGLSGKGWSVEECDNKYETLSGVAFHTGLPP